MKLYEFTAKAESPHGGDFPRGTVVCSECMGTWAPADKALALTHEIRGVCDPKQPERTAKTRPIVCFPAPPILFREEIGPCPTVEYRHWWGR
jgi:hypothetical protein